MQQPQQTGYNVGPGFAQAQQPQQGQQTFVGGGGMQPRRQVFCANCGRTYDASSRFCPHCGYEYNPCPVCGADNQANARRCVTCGAQLASQAAAYGDTTCPRCRTMVALGTKFCPQCGMKLGQ